MSRDLGLGPDDTLTIAEIRKILGDRHARADKN